MTKIISKSKAEGTVCPPSSKSMAHRLLILASLCKNKTSYIHGITPSEDVLATIDCLRGFGVKIEYDGECAEVSGIDFSTANPTEPLNCRESGSTLRFLIPIAMLSGNKATFTGSKKLLSRPMTVYEKLAKDYGLTFEKKDGKITVCGPLTAGEYFIDGSVSSQFITGLMLALSALGGDSKIIVNKQIESRPYVDLTMDCMRKMGVKVYLDTDWSFLIFGGQEYKASDLTVEGDWSAAAFIEAFNHLGGKVELCGLNNDSLQGDKICREYFARLDRGFCEIDIINCPDLGPILFTVAAIKHGAKFVGTKRLRDKESDRISCMEQELSKLGAAFTVEENAVIIEKRELCAPTERLYGHNDHRIVMSLAVLSTLYGGEIEGCEAVQKSYPGFFEDIKKLGIKVYDVK